MLKSEFKTSPSMVEEQSKERPSSALHSSPKICLVDMGQEVQQRLAQKNYATELGSIGSYVNVPKSKPYSEDLITGFISLPPHLHEFDIVVVDLGASGHVEPSDVQANLKGITGSSAYAVRSSYPEQIFNPKPMGVSSLNSELRGMFAKESVGIVFTAQIQEVNYEIVEIGISGATPHARKKHSTEEVYPNHAGCQKKHGKKIQLVEKESVFSNLLSQHLEGAEYDVVFYHPYTWIGSEKVFDGNFIPLLTNKNGEIVGYATIVNKGWFFVLPQIKDKPNFLDGMFEVLAEIFPALFPEHGRFAWLDDGSYPLPGEEDLNQDRVRIEKQYASDISANEAGVARLKDEYQFLRTMLTATGDDLVRAVCHFLNWLEFSGVTSMDDHVTDLFEEDIQVELGSGLLVVEVKGIGGTSKDKECAQISKIKHRRQEERQAFDVYALYVVNHQRHMPPRSRANPPFTAHQMNDAQLDKRGLVTTWQLYNVYFDVEGGLLDKSDVRQSLLMYGVVEFSPPSLSEIGTVSEVFKKGRVIILQLSDKSLKKGMELFSVKGGVYSRITVLGLQVDGQDVDQAEACEVGISIDTEVKRGAKIFMSV